MIFDYTYNTTNQLREYMKSPFQNYLRDVLREQTIEPQPITVRDLIANPNNSLDALKPNAIDLDDIDLPIDIDEPGDVENDAPPLEIPNGLEPGPDEDGDGFPDYFTGPDGQQYGVEWIMVEINGEMRRIVLITHNLSGYTLAYANGMYSLVVTNSDGVPVLIPNLSVANFLPNGQIQWVYQDQVGNFWFTTGDPYATNPPATWTNPYTGGNAGGDSVDYPQGWGAWLGVQFDANGNPIGANIPLLPGGGQIPSGSAPGGLLDRPGNDWQVMIGVSIPFGGPGTIGGLRHRQSWNNFYNWHMNNFGFPPPNGTGGFPPWPTGSDWWKAWADAHL
tara:strand:+ start:5258 stop:6259 length:1002 start_codon:yes stop_codon:yes gene_type:complete